MSSFGCPHYDEPGEWCRRVRQYCVPGRPGCVLKGTSSFLVPVEERIRAREQEMSARAIGGGEREQTPGANPTGEHHFPGPGPTA